METDIIIKEKLFDENKPNQDFFHFPNDWAQDCQKRLYFDEILLLKSESSNYRSSTEGPHKIKKKLKSYPIKFRDFLSISLNHKKIPCKEVLDDFRKPYPANPGSWALLKPAGRSFAGLAMFAAAKKQPFSQHIALPHGSSGQRHYIKFPQAVPQRRN